MPVTPGCALLDKSVVCVGDIVTVEVAPGAGRPGYKIKGATFQPSHSEGLWVGYVALDSPLVTLIKHKCPPITASGGWCVPSSSTYDLMTRKKAKRHRKALRKLLRKSMPQAVRGGIKFNV